MKDFWEALFEHGKSVDVVLKDIAATNDYGNGRIYKDCIIAATDGSLEMCAAFDDFDTKKYRVGETYAVRLAFKCDYDYDFPTVFGSEAELKAQGLSMRTASVIVGQNENGDGEPIPTAILCGRITAIKEFGGAHIFEVSCGDKIFPVVFFQEKPNAVVGDILYGEFDVLARFSYDAED